jgi:hypothetical protein
VSERVQGYCPMGCGQTLFLGTGGHVTCSYIPCPDPTAADTILDDREHEHVVDLGEQTFTVRHPLRERVGDQILDCQLHNYLAELGGPPRRPGRYRAREDAPDLVSESVGTLPWSFEDISERDS